MLKLLTSKIFILLLIIIIIGCKKSNDIAIKTPTNSVTSTVNNNDNLNKFNINSPVDLEGMGVVKIGMTIEEAQQEANVTFKQENSGGEEYGCFYFSTEEIDKVSMMVTDNVIARIDINNPLVKTTEGVGIGDTETLIREIYGNNNIEEYPHEYIIDGKYVIFIPSENLAQDYGIIFNINSDEKVISFRSGKFPEVGYVEGCV